MDKYEAWTNKEWVDYFRRMGAQTYRTRNMGVRPARYGLWDHFPRPQATMEMAAYVAGWKYAQDAAAS